MAHIFPRVFLTIVFPLLISTPLRAEPQFDPGTTYRVSLPGIEGSAPASIREHAITWHPARNCYYLIADVVPLDSPHHPNTYETSLHLWRSPNLSDWIHVGVAVPAMTDGHYEAHGAASPTAMVYRDGKLYAAFSGRKTVTFTERGIGLAWSAANPDIVPWQISSAPVSDPPGEDDDAGLLRIPGDDRLHCYHRTTGGESGYRIVYTYSRTPEDHSSWSSPIDVTKRPQGVRAQELTGVAWLNGRVHLFIIEQGEKVKGTQIAHVVSAGPDGPFRPIDPVQRYLSYSPGRLAYGGHFTPVARDGSLVAAFWTVMQEGKRYGLQGHPAASTIIDKDFSR